MNIYDIRLIATDVDGVLTDGKIFYDADGRQGKLFSIKDGIAFRMLKIAGLKSAIISGKTAGIVRERLSGIDVDLIFENVENKLAVMEMICGQESVSIENVCYIGDDAGDIPVLKKVGFSVAPCDAVEDVKNAVMYVTGKRAGEGVFRECVEIILRGQNKWEKTLEKLLQSL
ncbi:MAG: HAD hydrolase family protein [Candidatus Omnitrophica bacterium]|nr:HAD hydrolase family protein [Candidatus Omnitrophota bacterium]MCM8827762.1 HAD hydrolase family protein [Candidatus Omnitrophota bacterium]